MAMPVKTKPVHAPNLGLYLGVPPLHVPARGMVDCLNVRIKQQAIDKGTLGWKTFPDGGTPVNLEGKPVTLIELFVPRSLPQRLILGNTTDLFEYDEGTEAITYLTPRYQTGLVAATNGSPIITGTGTSWLGNVKAGDFILVGVADYTDLNGFWYEVDSVDSDTQITLTENYGTGTASSADYTIRQTFTGTLFNPWFAEPFLDAAEVDGTDGDRIYLCNGVDSIVAWDGVDDQVYEPVGFAGIDTCSWMKRFNNIMVLLAPQVSGELRSFSIRTSAIGQPENVTDLEAAEFKVHDGADVLLTAFEFGELLVLYSERHMTLMQFVGFPGVGFVFRNAVTGMGPRSKRAVAQFPDYHLIIGADAQYHFDGSRATDVNNHVWREIVRRTSPQRLDLIHSHFDEENGELLWVIPLNSDTDPDAGAPENAYVAHYLEDVGDNPTPHTFRELPATATGYFQRSGAITWDTLAESWEEYNFRWNDQALQDAFPYGIFGTVDGDVFILNSQDTKNGVAMNAYARFGRRPLGAADQKGTVRRAYPLVERLPEAEHDLEVRVYTSPTADGAAVQASSNDYPMSGGDERRFVNPFVTAFYAELWFGTVGITEPWRLSGYDLDIVRAGRR